MRSLLAGLLLIGALGAGDAFAEKGQSQDGATQVRGYLSSEATKHTDEGFRADPTNPDFVHALSLESAVVWPITLRHGVTYRVFAVCDNNCSDVDLDLYDSSGAFVGSDTSTTDKPFVEITPTADGTAYARIWLADCQNEPCTIGARVYRKGP
ncbi:MAG: hypothetical protein ABUL73_02275 [Alphaproteobacteria bacterium]